MGRLSVISHEYSLLQIRKLHDPVVTSGKITLGIDYVLKYGGWSASTRPRLEGLGNELCDFAKQLLDARNKILSHNDLATILAGETLGDFAVSSDVKYFEALQEFVNIVHGEVLGDPFPFSALVENDVAFFLRAINPLQLRAASS